MSSAGIFIRPLTDAERGGWKERRRPTDAELRAFRRLNDLGRLVAWWRENGVVIADKAVGLAILIADAMAVVRHRAHRSYRELDYRNFAYRARDIGLNLPEDISDEVAMAALHTVGDRLGRLDPDGPEYKLHSDLTAGRLLNISHIERSGAEAWTLSAVNVSRAEADALAKERRRVLARERDRLRRKAAGATPRSESASRARPWDAFGISRRTWERRGKPTPETNPAIYADANSPASLSFKEEEAGVFATRRNFSICNTEEVEAGQANLPELPSATPGTNPVSAPSERVSGATRARRAPDGRARTSSRGRPFSQTQPWRAFGVSRAT